MKEIVELCTGLEGIEDIQELSPVTFILGDNMAFLRKMKEEMKWKYFHVGIVDPPYGIKVGDMRLGGYSESSALHKKRSYEMGKWDNSVPTAEYWELLEYCCRSLIVWGGNYFVNYLRPGRCSVVWDKMTHGTSFADFELALTTFDENSRIIKKARNGGKDEISKRHPTQKPVYVYDYLHLNFVERNQRVLDTHGGSFNHAIAAYKNNVNLVIMDQDKKYYEDGVDAYKQASSKTRLLF